MNNITVNDCYVIDNKWLDELDLPAWKEFKKAWYNPEYMPDYMDHLDCIKKLTEEFHEATLLNLVVLHGDAPRFGVTNATCFTMMGAKAFKEGKIKPYHDNIAHVWP